MNKKYGNKPYLKCSSDPPKIGKLSSSSCYSQLTYCSSLLFSLLLSPFLVVQDTLSSLSFIILSWENPHFLSVSSLKNGSPYNLIFFFSYSLHQNENLPFISLSPATLSLVHHFLYVSFLPFHSRSLYLAQNAHFLLKMAHLSPFFFSVSTKMRILTPLQLSSLCLFFSCFSSKPLPTISVTTCYMSSPGCLFKKSLPLVTNMLPYSNRLSKCNRCS